MLTQRDAFDKIWADLILYGRAELCGGKVIYQAPPSEDFSIIKHLPPNGATA